MKVNEVIQLLDDWAPRVYQESYDNANLICGNSEAKVSAALLTLDCTEEVVDEAIEKNANLIIAHHPIVFTGLKSLTGASYVERTIIKAIKNDIAIYAIHTNLDNVANGVNGKIGEKLGMEHLKILAPKNGSLLKLFTFIPSAHVNAVLKALFDSGAGHIGNYDECSFRVNGEGTFRGLDGSNPFAGTAGVQHEEKETKVEVIFPKHLQGTVIKALIEAHPYEEVAYDIIQLQNVRHDLGSGMIGTMKKAMSPKEFLSHLAEVMNLKVIRHTALLDKPIQRVAFCGGAGGFLLPRALAEKADAFVTSDFKYHEFFDHENKLTIFDIGHFESEQFTPELIGEYLAQKNVTFAVLLSGVNTNPVHYFIR
ncbi:MAG: Nif3-like dinuclear metal center hexameric protein [Salibacteraceae bacterium]